MVKADEGGEFYGIESRANVRKLDIYEGTEDLKKASHSQGCLKYSEQFGLVHFNGLRRPPLLVDLHLVLGE